MAALHEMLLQVRDGVIVLFPAMPQAWRDTSFENLRVEGALLVSAAREDGKLKFFSVRNDGRSESRCRVRLSHGKLEEQRESCGHAREDGVELEFVLQSGESIEFDDTVENSPQKVK
jgi:hypothetical protein